MSENKKKGRGFGFFSDDFEDLFERMREDMEKMMRSSFTSMDEDELEKLSRDPRTNVYGFSMRVGPDGKPIIREFGNVKPGSMGIPSGKRPGGEKKMESQTGREPLVDVITKEEIVTVIAELPGVEKSEIDLTGTGDSLTIEVNNPNRRYHKELEMPVEILPETAKARYKNGVLEVDIERKEKAKEGKDKKGKNIKID